MMVKKYMVVASLLIIIVIGVYVYHFYFSLGYTLSEKTSDWVDFSDYVGGLLGPILSFLSLVLLVQSLKLQNDANLELRNEAKLNQKNETFRTFENHFFGLLDAQRVAFEHFRLDISLDGLRQTFVGVHAVMKLEDFIESMRDSGLNEEAIEYEIEMIDNAEKIYNTLRIFYNITKAITDKLSDEKGFSAEDRESQFKTLIHFTEFSQFRLILIAIQFMKYPSSQYLRFNLEFINVLNDLGIDIDPY